MPHEEYRNPSPYLLEGQVGLVTGAGSAYGIGRSLVKKLALAGAKAIYACDLNISNIASLQEEVKQIRPACNIETQLLDVSSEKQTLEVLKTILHKYGRFDFYFANAGFSKLRLVDGYPSLIQDLKANFHRKWNRDINNIQLPHFQLCINVMTTSVFFAIKYGGRAMMVTSPEKPVAGGSIVVTSSIAGVNPGFGDIAYCESSLGVQVERRTVIQLIKMNGSNFKDSCHRTR